MNFLFDDRLTSRVFFVVPFLIIMRMKILTAREFEISFLWSLESFSNSLRITSPRLDFSFEQTSLFLLIETLLLLSFKLVSLRLQLVKICFLLMTRYLSLKNLTSELRLKKKLESDIDFIWRNVEQQLNVDMQKKLVERRNERRRWHNSTKKKLVDED
jgi:hypothetical protein